MPAVYFLPLPDQTGPARPEHLHAAITEWLDRPASEWQHRSTLKPYAISPVTVVAGQVGVEIGVLTDSAERLVYRGAQATTQIRLGRRTTRTGDLQLLRRQSWDELASSPDRVWQLEFLTPTTFRTQNRCTALPTPAVVLRTPTEAWDAFAPVPLGRLSHAEQSEIWVSEIDVCTEHLELTLPGRQGRGTPRMVPAILGSVTFRCDDPTVAAKAGAFFQLAPYCGIGSFRGKGMGVVRLGGAA